MPRLPLPSDKLRRHLSRFFGRRHGIPTERPPKPPREVPRARTRHAVEDAIERQRLRDSLDWLDWLD